MQMLNPTKEALEALRKWYDKFTMQRVMRRTIDANEQSDCMDVESPLSEPKADPPPKAAVEVRFTVLDYIGSLEYKAYKHHFDVPIFLSDLTICTYLRKLPSRIAFS